MEKRSLCLQQVEHPQLGAALQATYLPVLGRVCCTDDSSVMKRDVLPWGLTYYNAGIVDLPAVPVQSTVVTSRSFQCIGAGYPYKKGKGTAFGSDDGRQYRQIKNFLNKARVCTAQSFLDQD